jgi:hypothetical protein
MELKIITGLCGSGKTHFCNGKNTLSYDNVYSYQLCSLDYEKINNFLENNKNNNDIYLDAYNNDLVKYLMSKYSFSNISIILIYTDLDCVYNTIAIEEPRQFNQTSYEGYISSMKSTINTINENIKNLKNEIPEIEIKYYFRDGTNYIVYENDNHLYELLNESKKDRLLRFIDNTSGAKMYQSILLNNEYIRKGTEQDWVTFEKISECTTFKDKVVVDTGCFNGYFSFKAFNSGAKKVIGVDHNKPALDICNKICIYNNYHQWVLGKNISVSNEHGLHFFERKIGRDVVFDEKITNKKIDIIMAFNYLHHLKNELGLDAFLNTLDSFFKNAKELLFEINEPEIEYIEDIASKNNFSLNKKIESHRKTSFGNRWILYYVLK